MEHLRELRTRLVRSLLGVALGVIVAWYFYPQIFDWLLEPYQSVRPALEEAGVETDFVITGIGGAFQFQLKVSLIVGLILSSPIWIWQAWAFVLPALYRKEKRVAILLTLVCVPLFVGGAWVGYWTLPKAIELLIGFVPDDTKSLLTAAEYLTFATRMMLLFGVGALMPVVVVLLNRIGVVSGAQLARARPWIIVGIFMFAAIATPTVDPVTFLFLAIPMSVMHLFAELLARVTDRKRARRVDAWDDEDASEIDGPEPMET